MYFSTKKIGYSEEEILTEMWLKILGTFSKYYLKFRKKTILNRHIAENKIKQYVQFVLVEKYAKQLHEWIIKKCNKTKIKNHIKEGNPNN